jgi:DNA mismatch repair protein MutL
MTPRIHTLSPLLANQIAAGEVIERPASVVKELLENSMDAGATQLSIEIEKSGKQLIRIRDNGNGIHPDDLLLAVSSHATSKISQPEDLEQIQSLGFRGEALASIAAVSDFRLVSAIENSDAVELILEAGKTNSEQSPAAHPRGTTIEVRELFKNTPARRRFLRSDTTEWSHIIDIVRKIALSRNNLAITLIHNTETILQVSAAGPNDPSACLRRIQKIIGKSRTEKMIALNEEAEGLQLKGWINSPEQSYPHNDAQYFFLNGRVIRDKVIQHALRIAAQDVLPLGRHASYVLYLTCDPSLVDVNVHPTKHEVRFQEPRLFHDFIVRALERMWQNSTVVREGIAEERAEYDTSSLRAQRSNPDLKNTAAGLTTVISTKNDLKLDCHVASAPRNDGRILTLSHQRYLIAEIPQGLLIIDIVLWDPNREKDLQTILNEVLNLEKTKWKEPEIKIIRLRLCEPSEAIQN